MASPAPPDGFALFHALREDPFAPPVNPNPAGAGVLPRFPHLSFSCGGLGGSRLAPRCQRALGSSRGIQQVVIKCSGLINVAGEGRGSAGGGSSGGEGRGCCPQPSAPRSAPAQPLSVHSDGSAFLLLLLLLLPGPVRFTSGLHGMQQPDAETQAALEEPGHPGSPLRTPASVSPHAVGARTP